MNQPFEEFGFTLELTRDGSPTLRLNQVAMGEIHAESMHHSAGAASETWYVYGAVIEKVFQVIKALKLDTIKTCSIGLGLGYIEQVWALNALAYQKQINKDVLLTLDSFEIIPSLVDCFLDWVLQKTNKPNHQVYDLAYQKLVEIQKENFKDEKKQILKDSLLTYLENQYKNNFNIFENILNYKDKQKWNIICFDAFSKKSSAALWTDSFLNHFIKNHCNKDCVFTTYACTAELKKILTDNNFIVLKRLGFSGKRDSTLAVRGKYINIFTTSVWTD
ncbi:MAG: MnmC family methyltransferase [Pseudobdellovibrio sp.]